MPQPSPDTVAVQPSGGSFLNAVARRARAADQAACRQLIRHGSKSFFFASLLLPERVREPACALYAFCRLADDEVDDQIAGQIAGQGMAKRSRDSLGAVERLRERLERAYAGQPLDIAADRAFADTVARYAIPRALPEALIEGFAWDATGRTYETIGEVRAYGVRVAGSVGAMMALLMGARDEAAVARACDLGVAMQLTNIARDVGEDARAGRLYLPRQWLAEAGVDAEAWMADPAHSPGVAMTVARLLAAAEALYERAGSGIAGLPAGCRPGIWAARHLYAEIGREVARRGHDSVAARAAVARSRQMQLMGKALVAAAVPGRARALPPLAEAAHLVEAVRTHPVPGRAANGGLPWWDLDGNVGRALEILFPEDARKEEGRRDYRDAPASGLETV